MITPLALILGSAIGKPMPGLPVLISPNPYRILSESVEIDIHRDGVAQISTTTVYRNSGDTTNAKITLPGYPIGTSLAVSASVTWDKSPSTVTLNADQVPTVQVSLGAQATHALRVIYSTRVSRAGYGSDEFRLPYALSGTHPIELFSMAYRYREGTVFGEPSLSPNLTWQVGDNGASIRKENFEPNDSSCAIQFYFNSMRPLHS